MKDVSRSLHLLSLVLVMVVPLIIGYQIIVVMIAQGSVLYSYNVQSTWEKAMLQNHCLSEELNSQLAANTNVYVGNGSTSLDAVALAIAASPHFVIVHKTRAETPTLELISVAGGCDGLAVHVIRARS